MYEKYHVKGYSELKNTWEEYVHEKESEKMYASNTRLLAGYEQSLLDELHRAGFVHPQPLVSQPEILFNSSELQRYKQSLEESREKLRRMLDDGMKQAMELKKEVEDARERYPGCSRMFDAVYE